MKVQGISWKKCNGSNQYIDDDFEKWVAFVSKVLLEAFCVLLFVYSARMMLADVFYWAEFNGENVFKIFLISLVMSGVMEYADDKKKKISYILQWGILILGTVIILKDIVYGEQAKDVVSGINKIIGLYIEDWNAYYGSSMVYATGKIINVVQALDFLTLVLFFVLFWIAKMLKKNLIMAILPGMVLVMEFLIGYSPEYNGLLALFIGFLLANTTKWYAPDFCLTPGSKYLSFGSVRFFSWVLVAVCIYFLSGVINLTGSESAKNLLVYSDDMQAFYDKVAYNIQNASVWDLIEGVDDSNKEELSNDSPIYKNIDVLGITLGKRPVGNFYLKGFCAGDYENGVWELDTISFEQACLEEGFTSEEVSREILTLPYQNVLNEYGSISIYSTQFGYKASIYYYENTGKKVFLPYFSEVPVCDDITMEGDARYRKSRKIYEVILGMWQFEGDYQSRLALWSNDNSSKIVDWYNRYVYEEYLDVPEGMINVKNVAQQLIEEEEFITSGGNNYINLRKAKAVAKWMQENTRYSLNPPSLPEGIDPIEYFLGESKMGYCMHYASASVMILREMGVPARYASGYIAREDSVTGLTGNYKIDVQDNDAHAWVEIYLENIGWVPFEVTKGYNESVIPEETTTNRNNNIDYPTTEKATSSEETTTKKKDEVETSTAEKETSSSNEEMEGQSGGEGQFVNSEASKSKMRKVIALIVGFVMMTMVVFGFIYYKEKFRERLSMEISNKNTLRAIRMMNKRMYRKLRHTGKIKKSAIRDDEYKNVLIANYPQVSEEHWEKYMDIVKAAAFSKRDFTVEEMEFCYKMYCLVVEE